MPTYEYECKSCGYYFDVFQSMSDSPLTSCPQCGKEVRRIINGGSGIIFKGSGFYVTDKKGGNKPSSSAKPTPGGASPNPSPADSSPPKAETGGTDHPVKNTGGGQEKKAAG
jgi:putative FmdB family regulatory protein